MDISSTLSGDIAVHRAGSQLKKKIALERLRSKGIRGELLQSDPRSSWPVCAPPTHTVHLPQPLTANLTLALPYAR